GPDRRRPDAFAQGWARQVRDQADRRSAGRNLVGDRGYDMTTPKYLEAFRRAAQGSQTREISEVSEKRGEAERLNSLNPLNSPPEPPGFGRFGRTFSVLEARCPNYVAVARWQQCVEDGREFLAKWGSQAEALGWTSADLFGLHKPPDNPHPSYN